MSTMMASEATAMTGIRIAQLALVSALLLVTTGCTSSQSGADARSGALTAGMVEMTVVKGRTTQTEVIEAFGPPDILSHKDGREVWTYDKTTFEIEQSSNYFTVIVVGGDRKKSRSTSISSMVILYFDSNEVVEDYRLNIVRY